MSDREAANGNGSQPENAENVVQEGTAGADSVSQDSGPDHASDQQDHVEAGADGSAKEQELALEVQQLKEQMLRIMAEGQNIQRRAREEMDRLRKYSPQGLATELLPVLDNFERTLQAAKSGSSLESLLTGVQAVERQLVAALEKSGIRRIESVGKQFDPHFHEAIATDSTSDQPVDTITAEIEPGYCLHDRILRPAKVRVVTDDEG